MTTDCMYFSEQDIKFPEKGSHQGKIKKNSSMVQARLSDESDLDDESSPRSLIKGSPKSMQEKSPADAKDDVISDMDYLKIRIKKNWSDSETDDDCVEEGDQGSGDNHNDGSSHMDGKDHIVKQGNANDVQLYEENIAEENSDVDNMDSENPTYNDDKRLALETGRLFVRNLPYLTKYRK